MIDEKEAKFYALLDMCDNIAKKADTAISQLEATRTSLEAGEHKRIADFSEALQRLNDSEAQHKSDFEQWKKSQAQEWQDQQKTQAQDWKATQAQDWQNWQNARQDEMLNSIESFNMLAADIIEVLNSKVQDVSISQTKFDNLVTKGTSEAINNAIDTSAKEALALKFDGIESLLSSSQNKITAMNKSIQALKDNVTDGLENTIANKVEAGVSAGLTIGLDQAADKITDKLNEIENASDGIADNFRNNFDTIIKNSKQSLIEATHSSIVKIRGAENAVTEASENTRKSISKIVHIANDTVDIVKNYHDKLLNRRQWKLVIGWNVILALFFIILHYATSPSPSTIAEYDSTIADRKQKIAVLDSQISDMTLQMKRATSQYENGKLYYSVDKSDCHDSFGKNFCVVK